jgi:hypothetical protein
MFTTGVVSLQRIIIPIAHSIRTNMVSLRKKNVQECLALSLEYQSIFAISLDKEIAILKIDSEKALDKFLYYVKIVGLWTEIH